MYWERYSYKELIWQLIMEVWNLDLVVWEECTQELNWDCYIEEIWWIVKFQWVLEISFLLGWIVQTRKDMEKK